MISSLDADTPINLVLTPPFFLFRILSWLSFSLPISWLLVIKYECFHQHNFYPLEYSPSWLFPPSTPYYFPIENNIPFNAEFYLLSISLAAIFFVFENLSSVLPVNYYFSPDYFTCIIFLLRTTFPMQILSLLQIFPLSTNFFLYSHTSIHLFWVVSSLNYVFAFIYLFSFG